MCGLCCYQNPTNLFVGVCQETVNFANSLSESIGKVYDHLISLTDKMIKYSHHMKELELRIVDLENQLKKKEEGNI